MKRPRKTKGSTLVSFFYDPKLSDRELMLLVLYEITRLRADVKTLTKATRLSKEAEARFREIVALADQEAFQELEEDIDQFVHGKRQASGN